MRYLVIWFCFQFPENGVFVGDNLRSHGWFRREKVPRGRGRKRFEKRVKIRDLLREQNLNTNENASQRNTCKTANSWFLFLFLFCFPLFLNDLFEIPIMPLYSITTFSSFKSLNVDLSKGLLQYYYFISNFFFFFG